jgi:hypothetical protein
MCFPHFVLNEYELLIWCDYILCFNRINNLCVVIILVIKDLFILIIIIINFRELLFY